MEFRRRAGCWVRVQLLTLLILVPPAAFATGPHVARRSAASGGQPVRQVPAMRIGSLAPLAPPAAATSTANSGYVVRRGATPAGGLTVELNGRFTTQIVLRRDRAGVASQCSVDGPTDSP